MKVLFLDIDGVLTIDSDISKKTMINDNLSVPYMWNREACEKLSQFLRDNWVEVVLSSDWRNHYRLPDMRDIFEKNGLPPLLLIGYTTPGMEYMRSRDLTAMGVARSKEIDHWLAVHGVKEWAAVDDLDLSYISTGGDRFVRCTNPDKGILEGGVLDKLKRILG